MQRIADYAGSGIGALQNRYVYGDKLDEVLIMVSNFGTLSYLENGPAGTTFGFTGQRYDSDAGLYYYKRRYYSPTIGRFLQPDPIGYVTGDLNLYAYVVNDSLNRKDPLGLIAADNNSILADDNTGQNPGVLKGVVGGDDGVGPGGTGGGPGGITHKFACKKCQEGVVEGKRPSQILSGGKATEGLIAQISTAKHADHLPLYRQEQIYACEGVDVPRSSMGRWLDQSALSMKPIVDRMHELVLQSMMVEVDESSVRFLDKKILPKKSKMGYVWVLRGDKDHPYTIFDFQPDRTAARAKDLLRGYSNFLLTDGYGGYEWFDQVRSTNCNVHAKIFRKGRQIR